MKLKLDQTQFMGFQNILESFLKQVLHKSRVKTYIFRVLIHMVRENLKNLKKGMVSIFCSYIWQKNQL